MLRKTTAGLILATAVSASAFGATSTEFYRDLLNRGISTFATGALPSASTQLHVAAFGLVDSLSDFETAQVYIAIISQRQNDEGEARHALLQLVTAEKIDPHYRTLALPANVRTELEGVSSKLLTHDQYAVLFGTEPPRKSVPQVGRPVEDAPPELPTPVGATVAPVPNTITTTPSLIGVAPDTHPTTNTTIRPATTVPATTTTTPAATAPAATVPPPASTNPPPTTSTTAPVASQPATVAPQPTKPETAATSAQAAPTPAAVSTKQPAVTAATAPKATPPPAPSTTTTTKATTTTVTTTSAAASKPPAAAPAQATTTKPADTSRVQPATAPIRGPITFDAAEAEINRGNLAGAAAIYTRLLSTTLSHSDALRAATGLYRTRDFRDTLRAFDAAGPLQPGEELNHYYLAVALYETGQYVDAKRELALALPHINITPDVERYRVKIENAIE